MAGYKRTTSFGYSAGTAFDRGESSCATLDTAPSKRVPSPPALQEAKTIAAVLLGSAFSGALHVIAAMLLRF